MAAFSGTAGSVVYATGGTTLVGGISEWSIDISMSPVEDTEFGQTFDTFVPSVRNYTGSFSGNHPNSDAAFTNLQNAMIGGSAVSLRLYINATKYWNVGTAYITGQSSGVSAKGKGEGSFNFQGSGALTYV